MEELIVQQKEMIEGLIEELKNPAIVHFNAYGIYSTAKTAKRLNITLFGTKVIDEFDYKENQNKIEYYLENALQEFDEKNLEKYTNFIKIISNGEVNN